MNSDFKPAELDIEIVKGDYWVEVFALSLNSTPINLTSQNVEIEITQGCSTTVLWSATAGDGITITGASNNQISLSKLVNLDAGNYEYVLKVTYTTGVVKTYIWGNFVVYESKP